MTADIKRVNETLKDMLTSVKAEVEACERELGSAKAETVEAVGLARTMVKGVRDDVAELRGLLGIGSNFPPAD